jgi:PAS domain S-box-containing protein
MTKYPYELFRFLLAIVSCAIIFAVDLITPSGYAEYFFYVIPVLLLLHSNSRSRLLILTVTVSILIFLGLLLATSTVINNEAAIANRIIALLMVWVVAYVAWQYHLKDIVLRENVKKLGDYAETSNMNITVAQNSFKALKEAEARNNAIINSSLECIVIGDATGSIMEFNPAAESMFRYEKKQVLGKQMIDILIPAYLRQMYLDGMANYIKTGEGPVVGEHVEINMIRSDGTKFPAELTFTPSSINNKIFFTAHIRDLAEIKKIEKSLSESRQKLELAMQENRNIMDYSLDVICTLDGKGNFVRVSHACERIWGYQAAELEGKKYIALVHEDDVPKSLAAYEAIMAGRATFDFENRLIKKDGSLVNMMWSAYWLEGSNTMFCVARDITERKRIELELYRQNEYLIELQETTQSLNDALEQRAEELSSSNSELERFAYIASHDLQEPLRMISSFLQLLQKKYNSELDEQAQKYIGFAVDASERMKRLIMDLLEYSRIGSNKEPVTEVDLNKVLDEILKVFNSTMSENNIQVHTEPMPVIRGIESQIYQLFQNLISNAIKYRSPVNPEIWVSVKETNTHWMFSVKDNGIGMDKQYFNKIFIIFQRLHSKTEYSGTGIGLAICKKITERHQGNIWVESEVGQGSTFYFTLLK